MKKQRFSIAICALLLSLTAEIASAQSVLQFRPPSRGTPILTRGGASRGDLTQATQFQAIAPQTNFGFTTAERPSLLLYIPKTSAKLLKVSLRSPDGRKTLFSKEYPVPATAGIVRIDLAEPTTAPLAVNREYRWFAALFTNTIDRSTGTVIEGRIERVQPDRILQQKLKQAKPDRVPFVYAESQIWWDTVLSLDTLRKAQPNNADLNQQWHTLLESIGLKTIAMMPTLTLAQMELR